MSIEYRIRRSSNDRVLIPHGGDPVAVLRRTAEKGEQVALTVRFSDISPIDNNELQRMQTELIACSTKGDIKSLGVEILSSGDPHTTQTGLDFFLGFVKRPHSKIRDYSYKQTKPLTVQDARKIATSIQAARKNGCAIHRFAISSDFELVRSFVLVFNAVLNNGVREFFGGFESADQFSRLYLRESTIISTNTTLKVLLLCSNFRGFKKVDNAKVATKFAKQLSTVLKWNVGLQRLHVDKNAMAGSEGREILLKALRNNGTLLRLRFYGTCPLIRRSLPHHRERKEMKIELKRIEVIQKKIDAELEANRIWKRYDTNYLKPLLTTNGGGSGRISSSSNNKNKNSNSSDKKKKSIAVGMYPAILEALANKPMHMYPFLKRELPHLMAGGGRSLSSSEGGVVVTSPSSDPPPVLLRRSKRIAANSLKEDLIRKKLRK